MEVRGVVASEGRMKGKPWKYFLFYKKKNICGQRGRDRDRKRKWKVGRSKNITFIFCWVERRRKARPRSSIHPSIQTLKPRRWALWGHLEKEWRDAPVHINPPENDSQKRKRTGSKMSTVRKEVINCGECNKQERNWGKRKKLRAWHFGEDTKHRRYNPADLARASVTVTAALCQSDSLTHSHHLFLPIKSSLRTRMHPALPRCLYTSNPT